MKNDKSAASAAMNKFKSTEELSSAYAALEREFTKRCQLVKDLQAKLAAAMRSACEDGSAKEHCAIASSAAESDKEPPAAREPVAPDTEKVVCDNASAPACAVVDAAANEKALDELTESIEGTTGGKQELAIAPSPDIPPVAAVEQIAAESAVRASDVLDEVASRADELSDALSLIPEVMEACIARYKMRLMGIGGHPAPRGAAVVAPVKRPKTLSDAKRIADEMLK